MKKSFDYFKTLKEMSVAVGYSYSKMIKAEEFNKEIIQFSGLKWELSNNLFNEFVAPIERNDIYNLSDCLNDELYYITKLNNIIGLVNMKEFSFIESITSMFNKQNSVFQGLCDVRNFENIFKTINENKATLNGVNTSIVLTVKNCLKKSEQPLLKYSVITGFFDLYKSMEKTFSEIQRVIINSN